MSTLSWDGWMHFWGGSVGRVVAQNFPILQIHPQFGYILLFSPQSCIRWRLRFHSCSTILPFQLMQRMSRDSPEATDMSHVLPWSHAPNSPGLHLSTFTLYNLQNEWVRGGTRGWRWRFRPCFLLAQKLWVRRRNVKCVHILWIWKSQVRPFLEQKLPDVGLSMSMAFSLNWSGHHPRQKELQRWDSAVNVIFFGWKIWGYTLDIYHGTGKNAEETCGNLR